MKRLIEILIVVVILFLLAAAVGCKEKPSLSEWHWDTIIKENRADGYYITGIYTRRWEAYDIGGDAELEIDITKIRGRIADNFSQFLGESYAVQKR